MLPVTQVGGLVPPAVRGDKAIRVSEGIVAFREVRFAFRGYIHTHCCAGSKTPTERAVTVARSEWMPRRMSLLPTGWRLDVPV